MRFSLFALLSMLLFSCSNTQLYEDEAKKICSCTEQSNPDEQNATEQDVNLGICLLGAKVNLKDQEMITQIEKQCPDLKEEYERFVRRLKTEE